MKTISWNEFCELIERPNINIKVGVNTPEIFYNDDDSISFEWEKDYHTYKYYIHERDNLIIVADGNKVQILTRDEDENKKESIEVSFYSVQPHNI